MAIVHQAFPNRRTYAWLAVAAMGFAVYVSLIPFTLRSLPPGEAVRGFSIVLTAPAPGRLSRTNFLANLLLFLPVGFGLAGARLADRERRVRSVAASVGVTLALSVAVSLTAEFLQMFAPGRVPARSDVEAQTVGCLAGLAGWLLFGQPLTAWLRDARTRNAGDRLAKALAAYAVVWAVVNLAPFDITLDLGELAQRVRGGLITLVPFGGMARPASRIAWDVLITTLSAVPLGVLGLTGHGRRRHTPSIAFAIGAGLVLAMEGAQIFVASHAADVTDAIFGCLGVGIGVLVGMHTLTGATGEQPALLDARRRWSIGLLTAWCLVLLIYHWMPYDFTLDPAMVREKLAGVPLVPFAGYASGADLNALSDLLVKVGLAAPLGATIAFVVRRDGDRATGAAFSLAAATLLFTAIEAGQLFLPTRSPDPGDVFVGVLGTAAGLWLGRWLRSGP